MDIRSVANTALAGPALNDAALRPSAPKTAALVELSVAVGQSAPTAAQEQLDDALTKINQAMQAQSRGVEFSIDDESKRTIVRVVDQETNEVLRQIPSEEALAIAKALDQALGLLIKQQA